MTNKIKFLLSLLVIGMGTTGIAMGATSLKTPLAMATEGESIHQCASIHFGMDDSTLMGDADLGASTIGANGHELGVVKGITLNSYSVTKRINKGKSTYPVYSNGSGLKFSTGSLNGELVLSFDSNIQACDIYAVGWRNETATLSINGSEPIALSSNNDITGTGIVQKIEYNKYHFDFERTADLIITATKRFVIGDIALRLYKE